MSRFQRIETKIDGPILIEPAAFRDDRGFFLETYRRKDHSALGIEPEFIQDNHSRSTRGTIRALHFQLDPGQAKLIRAARGEIYDVVVDLRKNSPSYGEWESFMLSDDNHRQLFVPIGFAHGFCVTSDVADVTYKVSSYYDATTERGIAFDDPALAIPWPVDEPTVSDRDRSNPALEQVAPDLPW